MFFKKKTESKSGGLNGSAKTAPAAGPQVAVEIPPEAAIEETAAPTSATTLESSKSADTPTAKPLNRNVIRNNAFTAWSKGDRFDEIQEQQLIADDWLISFGSEGVKLLSVRRGDPPAGKGGCSLVIDVTEPGDGGSWFALHQRIPDARTLAGQQIKLSFWARSTVVVPIGIGLSQVYGAGKERVVTWGVSAPLTTDWAEYSVSFGLPELHSAEVDQDSSLNVDLNLPKGHLCKLEFALVSLSESATS